MPLAAKQASPTTWILPALVMAPESIEKSLCLRIDVSRMFRSLLVPMFDRVMYVLRSLASKHQPQMDQDLVADLTQALALKLMSWNSGRTNWNRDAFDCDCDCDCCDLNRFPLILPFSIDLLKNVDCRDLGEAVRGHRCDYGL